MTAAAIGASWGWSLPSGGSRPVKVRAARPGKRSEEAQRKPASSAAVLPLGLGAGLVLALGVAIAARGPITHALGTAPPTAAAAGAAASSSVPARGAALPGAGDAAAAPPVPHVRLHRPHDPFAPRVAAGGQLLPFVTPVSDRRHAVSVGHHTASRRAGTCRASGSSYVVKPGDSLWRIAGGDAALLQRIYAANRAAIGPQPSLLVAGITLCLPVGTNQQ